jgi:hypothetical protein
MKLLNQNNQTHREPGPMYWCSCEKPNQSRISKFLHHFGICSYAESSGYHY